MKNIKNSENVSVIVCVKNGEKIISNCLESIQKNNPKEIIVVDGMSTDKTVEIANKFDIAKVISDKGNGLAYARRIGVENAIGQYMLFVGPDNILQKDFIQNFVTLKNEWGFHAASVQTRVFEPITYWDRGLDFRWSCLMGKPGPLRVVGTPSLYDSQLFKSVQFSSQNMGPNDDTDIAEQLYANGYKLGLVPLAVFDQNGWDAATTWNRFKWYGTGDYYYYKKYRAEWSLRRKIFSVTHPLRQSFGYTIKAISKSKISIIPWLIYTMFARYWGWVSMLLKKEEK